MTIKYFGPLIIFSFLLCGCNSQKTTSTTGKNYTLNEVNPDYFKTANSSTKVTKVPCTLSNGEKSLCYQVVSNSIPTDHKMGPWCPTNISDDASSGGIWLSGGNVYDVDGEFVKNLSEFYIDSTWKMYDDSGNIFVTETEQDCINAANPNVGEDYKNFCVECLPSYIDNVSRTYLIPVKPEFLDKPVSFMGRGGRPDRGVRPERGQKPERGEKPEQGSRPEEGGHSVPSTRGIALNGVEFSAPAPVNNILEAYTLAPFDDAGGHINVHQGYHYHTATGGTYSVVQEDGHSALIGYAMDGYGIYDRLDANGNEPTDLDECRGHYDEVRGYHYHVDAPGNNNFINCLHGAFPN